MITSRKQIIRLQKSGHIDTFDNWIENGYKIRKGTKAVAILDCKYYFEYRDVYRLDDFRYYSTRYGTWANSDWEDECYMHDIND